jgi:tetratricopeptide (TPR) repeat protein
MSIAKKWLNSLTIPVGTLLLCVSTAVGGTAEIKGKVTNEFSEEEYLAVTIIITDRLGVEIGRTNPNKSGRYEIKISGPRYVIIKATLDGYPTPLYQLDTEEYSESTDDRPENQVFGAMRILTYYQDITFGEKATGGVQPTDVPMTMGEILATEDPKAVEDYQEAIKKRDEGDLKSAVKDLEKLTEKHPDFYVGYIELGMILAAQQENDRAEEVFLTALTQQPDRSWAYVGMGVVLNNKQDYESAAGYLEKAVEIEPNSVNAQLQLGHALFKLGDYDRALFCFERVVELDPGFHPLAYKTMASIYVSKQDAAGAADALEAYLEHFPDAEDADKVRQILAKLRP